MNTPPSQEGIRAYLKTTLASTHHEQLVFPTREVHLRSMMHLLHFQDRRHLSEYAYVRVHAFVYACA